MARKKGRFQKNVGNGPCFFSGEARDLRLSSICLAISAFYSFFDTVYVFDIPYINVIYRWLYRFQPYSEFHVPAIFVAGKCSHLTNR